MKYFYPLADWLTSQYFGGNANPLYTTSGLKGHPAIDGITLQGNPYGQPVTAAVRSLVYKVVNRDNPDLSRYRAVCTLHQDGDVFVELQYGHMKDIYVEPGNTVLPLQVLGTCGNTGDVFKNGVAVSTADKLLGSRDGAHVHFQKRRCKRVQGITPGKEYLASHWDARQPHRDAEGFYYEYLDSGNGYAACSDPLPEMVRPTTADRIAAWTAIIKSYFAKVA